MSCKAGKVRVRERWGGATFRKVFMRIVQDCSQAGLITAETMHMDAALIRPDVSIDPLVAQHPGAVQDANDDQCEPEGKLPRQRTVGELFHTRKVERVHHRVYATRHEARRDLFAYIEGFYSSRRLHSAIGFRSPAGMERMAA